MNMAPVYYRWQLSTLGTECHPNKGFDVHVTTDMTSTGVTDCSSGTGHRTSVSVPPWMEYSWFNPSQIKIAYLERLQQVICVTII